MSSREWVETLYIAPSHPPCRVYAMPYPMARNQTPADLPSAHQQQDWREVARLDGDLELVHIEPGYEAFAVDIVGRQAGSHFEVTRYTA